MKYCPLKQCLNYCSNCKTSTDKFYLENNEKERYPIIRNNCITHIMHSKNINRIDNLSTYIKLGIKHYRIELFDENSDGVSRIINEIKSKI